MSTQPRRPPSRTHNPLTPSTSLTHLDLLLAGAPLKRADGIGFSDGEDSPTRPSKTGTRSERESPSLPSESDFKKSTHAYSPKHSSSLSLAFTPIGPTQRESTSAGPASTRERLFDSKMQASNTKARSYLAPHRRPPSLTLSPSYPSLESYDNSCLPEPEDAYYSPLSRLDVPPHLRKSESSPEEPPYSPPAIKISRGPYDEPEKYSHPATIEEEEEREEELVLERRTLDRVSIDLPAPVIEQSSSEEVGSSEGEDDSVDIICSSCGCAPVASFVALIPCDHLLCHTCLNALINSAAHKPPREMTCFMCSSPVASFGPAWENTGSLGLVEALVASLASKDSVRQDPPKKGKENAFPSDLLSPIGILTQANSSASHTRTSSLSTSTSLGHPRATSTPLRATVAGRGKSKWSVGTAAMGDASCEMSPYRHLDWSVEGPATPENARNAAWKAIGKDVKPVVEQVDSPQDLVIERPTDWPVVRLDNIPWDVTAAELEEWLPEGTLAPADDCVLAVHILCNRSDGRTLSQAYIETCSLEAARTIVRSRDGRKIAGRPVHVTLSNQTILMTTIFPSWEPGFRGIDAFLGPVPGPLLMQTELTGLVSLCKLESNHASKVKERPYYNIVTILEKFPWHQPETHNSKQIVRLFNTSCAAVEILGAVRECVPDWVEILTTMVDAVAACPIFLPKQKSKFFRMSGLQHTRYPSGESPKRNLVDSGFSFSPPSLRDKYVSVGVEGPHMHDESPSKILDLAPHSHHTSQTSPIRRNPATGQHFELSPTPIASRLSETTLAPNLLFHSSLAALSTPLPAPRSPQKMRRRRAESISRQLGVDDAVVRAVAEQLGVTLERNA